MVDKAYIKFLALAATMLLHGRALHAQEMSFWKKDPHTLVAYGTIIPGTEVKFGKQDLQGVDTLIVNSGGGDVNAAVAIGSRIRDDGLKVVVTDFCFSACAYWIFLPAETKVLQGGAVLGLHGGSAEFDLARLLMKAALLTSENSRFLRGREMAQMLYARSGISEKLYQESARLTDSANPKIVSTARGASGDVTFEWTFDEAKDRELLERYKDYTLVEYRWEGGPGNKYWFPSQKELELLGVKGILEYHFPRTSHEVDELNGQYKIRLVGEQLPGQ